MNMKAFHTFSREVELKKKHKFQAEISTTHVRQKEQSVEFCLFAMTNKTFTQVW